MKFFFLIILSFFFLSSFSQKFPDEFIGNWQGDLLWYKQGNQQPQKIFMQLYISPIEKTINYTWHITYDKKSENKRPYVLKPVDTNKGHWIIDEMNGIILDQYFVGEKFCSAFSVSNTAIINCYWVENGKMVAEFLSYDNQAVNTTGGSSDDIPSVKSYSIKSYQKAELIKVNNY
jgi:hypothetical protein